MKPTALEAELLTALESVIKWGAVRRGIFFLRLSVTSTVYLKIIAAIEHAHMERNF